MLYRHRRKNKDGRKGVIPILVKLGCATENRMVVRKNIHCGYKTHGRNEVYRMRAI